MNNLTQLLILAGVVLTALIVIGMIFSRLYRRSTKERAFVRTGLGGQKVIMDGGALVLPVVHDTCLVNMNTLRLEVSRTKGESLITKDRMRVDVNAAFYVRVQPSIDSIAAAAQTLGARTLDPVSLKQLVEDKFVDALRATAATMTMHQLQDARWDFVQGVQNAVSEDLLKNGLELESVSLTSLDQTAKEYFNPSNAFDAEGLTKLTEETERRRKERNVIEQDTEVAVRQKDLGAEKEKLEIERQTEFLRLEQQRQIQTQQAEQMAQVTRQQAEKQQEAEQAKISSQQAVEQSRIVAERQVKESEVEKERAVRQRQIEADREVQLAKIQQEKTTTLADQEKKVSVVEAERQVEESEVEKSRAVRQRQIEADRELQLAKIQQERTTTLADQDKQISVAEKSRAQSEAERLANEARAEAARAAEMIGTAREVAIAERNKQVAIVEAQRQAEQQAIRVKVAAEADKDAAVNQAEAVRTKAEAQRVAYKVDAEGKQLINEAINTLRDAQIQLQIKLALIENLPRIIAESVKPMEAIDSIKIVQVDGLKTSGGGGDAPVSGSGNLADQAANAMLRYRAQQPLIDSLLRELGIKGGSLPGMTEGLTEGLSEGLTESSTDE
ncbi:MAG: flotillin family protein [Betaproteobacteria bacterium]|nr:flotillin family protein [Betaproteobacteria bacterium]